MNRIGKATSVFRRMNNIWSNSSIDLKIKLLLYNSIVLPTVLYASETWKSTVSASKKLDIFHQRYLRKILKISCRDHITTKEVLQRSQRMQDNVTERRVRVAGHILRLPEVRQAKMAFTWEPIDGKRKRGRSRITWRKTFTEDLKFMGKDYATVEKVAQD